MSQVNNNSDLDITTSEYKPNSEINKFYKSIDIAASQNINKSVEFNPILSPVVSSRGQPVVSLTAVAPVTSALSSTTSRGEYWKLYKSIVTKPSERKYKWNGKGDAQRIREFVDKHIGTGPKPAQEKVVKKPARVKLSKEDRKVKHDKKVLRRTIKPVHKAVKHNWRVYLARVLKGEGLKAITKSIIAPESYKTIRDYCKLNKISLVSVIQNELSNILDAKSGKFATYAECYDNIINNTVKEFHDYMVEYLNKHKSEIVNGDRSPKKILKRIVDNKMTYKLICHNIRNKISKSVNKYIRKVLNITKTKSLTTQQIKDLDDSDDDSKSTDDSDSDDSSYTTDDNSSDDMVGGGPPPTNNNPPQNNPLSNTENNDPHTSESLLPADIYRRARLGIYPTQAQWNDIFPVQQDKIMESLKDDPADIINYNGMVRHLKTITNIFTIKVKPLNVLPQPKKRRMKPPTPTLTLDQQVHIFFHTPEKVLEFDYPKGIKDSEILKLIKSLYNTYVQLRNEKSVLKFELTMIDPTTKQIITENRIYTKPSLSRLIGLVRKNEDKAVTKTSKFDSGIETLLLMRKVISIKVSKFISEDRQRSSGGFFKYYHNIAGLDLSDLQIYDKEQIQKVENPKKCIIHALLPQIQNNMDKLYKDNDDANIATQKTNEMVNVLTVSSNCYKSAQVLIRDLNKIASDLGMYISLRQYKMNTKRKFITDHQSFGVKNSTESNIYKIGLVDNHFFRNDIKIPITPFALKNYTQVIKYDKNPYSIIKINRDGTARKLKTRRTTPFQLVKIMMSHNNLITPLTTDMVMQINSFQTKQIVDSKNLVLNEGDHKKANSPETLEICKNIFHGHTYNTRKVITNKTKSILKLEIERRVTDDSSLTGEEVGIEILNKRRLSIMLNEPTVLNNLIERSIKLKDAEGIRVTKEEYEKMVKSKLNKLQKYLNKDGIGRVIYEKNYSGRKFTVGSIGMQNSSRVIRALLAAPYYIDIDQVNSHPVIYSQMLDYKYNVHSPILHQWANNRNEIIKNIQEELNIFEVTTNEIKRVGLCIINGGKMDYINFKNKYNTDSVLLNKLVEEIEEITEHIINAELEEYNNYVKTIYMPLGKNGNPKASYINIKLTKIENDILEAMVKQLIVHGIIKDNFYTNMFDGVQFVKHFGITEAVVKELIPTLELEIKEITGYEMSLSMKPMDKAIDFTFEDLMTTELLEKYKYDEDTKLFKGEKTLENIHNIIKGNSKEMSNQLTYNVCFFDFESNTSHVNKEGKMVHKEYMLSYKLNNGPIESIMTENCAELFLERMPNNTILIAHNVTYDMTFLYKHLDFTDKIIHFNNKLMSGNFVYKNKSNNSIHLHIKDSLSLITDGLGKFNAMFNLGDVMKEVFTYEVYNDKNLVKKDLSIKEAELCLKNKYPLDYKKKFMKFKCNINKLDLWTNKECTRYDHMKYAKFYCEKDVEVLQKGYNIFRDQVLEVSKVNGLGVETKIHLDIDKIPSLPSVAMKYTLQSKCFENIHKLSGNVRAFMQKSVRGGRVSTYDNKVIKTKDNKILMKDKTNGVYGPETVLREFDSKVKNVDFDGVSLYTSAMNRGDGLLKGLPKILTKDQCTDEFIKSDSVDGYFVEIEITKVNKHRPMAIIPIKQNNKNIYDDRIWVGQKIVVSYVCLEDLIKYHQIEYNILGGVYFNEGFNNNLKRTINTLFVTRLENKNENIVHKVNNKYKCKHCAHDTEFDHILKLIDHHRTQHKEIKIKSNPIQNIYKLIMNSAYGKTIIKPVEIGTVFKSSEEEAMKYIIYNNINVDCYYKIADSDKYIIKVFNNTNDHFNYPQVGSIILDHSKRIMNEVMQLADDLDVLILYQDTDSMHIPARSIKQLASEFKRIYKRELIGEGLGQFNSDFKEPGSCPKENLLEELYTTESIMLAPKVYYDRVRYGKNGDSYDHIRMKGVPTNSIKDYARVHNITVRDVYNKLYEGYQLQFDLLVGSVKFNKNKDLSYSNRLEFKRNIKIYEDVRI